MHWSSATPSWTYGWRSLQAYVPSASRTARSRGSSWKERPGSHNRLPRWCESSSLRLGSANDHRQREPQDRQDREDVRGALARAGRGDPRQGREGLRRLAQDQLQGASREDAQSRRAARRTQGRARQADDVGDGQAAQGRGDRGGKVRRRLPLLRRNRRAAPRGGEGGDRREALREALPSARLRAGGDAVELSLLAGVPLRRAEPDGRQRRPPQAFVQRA